MGLIDKLKVPALGLVMALSACGEEAVSVDGQYKAEFTERRYNFNDALVVEQTDYRVVDVMTLGSENRIRVDFIKPHDYDRNDAGGFSDSWNETFMMWPLEWTVTGTVKDGDLEIDMAYDAYELDGSYAGHTDFELEGKKRD